MVDTRVGFSKQGETVATTTGPTTVVVQTQPRFWRSLFTRLLLASLITSVIFNVVCYTSYKQYFSTLDGPEEKFHSGDKLASDKIAVLSVSGTIMPPFTERLIKQIEHCERTPDIKGVLLSIDSPGGLVADSHQIYYRLSKLRAVKPVFVQMKRMAASGGYYIAMGAGPEGQIFAEPTTWTGSIGVIIPRYDVSQLAENFGIKSDPLKTGEFKDALSPFRAMSDNEKQLWNGILGQAYDEFIGVIDTNRETLDAAKVRALATGAIYTAKDALASGLIDKIGFEEDAIAALKTKLGLSAVRVVTYSTPDTLVDVLLGQAAAKPDPWQVFLESSVPRALYYSSWLPALPQ